jgi:hypothetical protein
VDLVDDKQASVVDQVREYVHSKPGIVEPFRGDKEEVDIPGSDVGEHPVPLGNIR